jgi:hypothetical protein
MTALRSAGRLATAGLFVVMSGSLGVGTASAEDSTVSSSAASFDLRAVASPGSFCMDIPQVLIGQQICGGELQSSITSTTDPRGYAIAGLVPVPKVGSVPLLVPQSIPVVGTPIPPQVQETLKGIDYNNLPTQCQSNFPELKTGDSGRTCGGPTAGDAPLGFIGSGVNAHVQTSGLEDEPLATHAVAHTRAAEARFPGLQSVSRGLYSHAEGGLNDVGIPMSEAEVGEKQVSIAGGLITLDGVRSHTVVAFDGTDQGLVAKTSFSVESAKVAGIPVSITPKGVVVSTQEVPAAAVGPLTAQLNQALADAGGLGIKLLPAPPIKRTPFQVSAESGAILLTYRGTTGTEATISHLIGYTSASVSAVSADAAADGDAGDEGGAGSGAGTPDGSADDASHGAGSTGSDPEAPSGLPGLESGSFDGASGADGAPPLVSGPGVPGTGQQVGEPMLLRSFAGKAPLSNTQLRNLYPAFVALVLGSFVATRWRRRPGFDSSPAAA